MRSTLFKTEQIVKFTSKPNETAKYSVFPDLEKYHRLSDKLVQKEHVIPLLEKTLGSFLNLPNTPDGRKLYQVRLNVFSENDSDAGAEWFQFAGILIYLIRRSLPWTRVSRALSKAIECPDEPLNAICDRFEVSEYEILELKRWYETRGIQMYGLKESNSEWWTQICDEEERFKAIYMDVVKHSSRKLAHPNFRYLSDIYEDRTVLIQELVQKAWQAVVMTAHKPQVESLKLAKSYINSEIHKLAVHYTKTQSRQTFNEETGMYEMQELQLINNPDIDEGKQIFLSDTDEEYHNFEVEHALEENLSERQLKLVRVLSDSFIDPAFEIFADGKDRRKAAFQYFKVNEDELRESLGQLLNMETK